MKITYESVYLPSMGQTALVFLNVFLAICMLFFSCLYQYGEFYIPNLFMYSNYPIMLTIGWYFTAVLHPRVKYPIICQMLAALASFVYAILFLIELDMGSTPLQKYSGTIGYSQFQGGDILNITSTTSKYTSNVPVFEGYIGITAVVLVFSVIHAGLSIKGIQDGATERDFGTPPREYDMKMDPTKAKDDSFRIDYVRYTASVIGMLVCVIWFAQVVCGGLLVSWGFPLVTPLPNLLSSLYVLVPLMIAPPSRVSTHDQVKEANLMFEPESRKAHIRSDWRFTIYILSLGLALLISIVNIGIVNQWRNSNSISSYMGQCNSTAFNRVLREGDGRSGQTTRYFNDIQNVTYVVLNHQTFTSTFSSYAQMNCLDDWFNITVVALSGLIFVLHMTFYCKR